MRRLGVAWPGQREPCSAPGRKEPRSEHSMCCTGSVCWEQRGRKTRASMGEMPAQQGALRLKMSVSGRAGAMCLICPVRCSAVEEEALLSRGRPSNVGE